jgi:hypothetical protein
MQRILSPAGQVEQRMISLASRQDRPGTRPVVLFSNNKPNVDLLFDDLAARLREAGYTVVRANKANSAIAAPPELVWRLSQEAGWIINGVGD